MTAPPSATLLAVFLAAAILLLGVLRARLSLERTARLGKCMTIGDRELQEDHCGACEQSAGTLLVLADGMGRNYGGRIASRIAVETFLNLFQDEQTFEKPQYYFRKAFHAANRAILNALDDARGSACVAAAVISGRTLYYALAGNVKIAVFHGGDLVPVSEGHTIDVLAKQKYLRGNLTKEQALQLLEHRRLYNFVGQDGFRDIEFFSQPLPLRKGDSVVLMTDGVYETLGWRELEEELSAGKDAQRQALQIIERVNRSKQPNKDNAAVVVYRC